MQVVLVSISIIIFLFFFFSQKQHTTKVIEQHREKTLIWGTRIQNLQNLHILMKENEIYSIYQSYHGARTFNLIFLEI